MPTTPTEAAPPADPAALYREVMRLLRLLREVAPAAVGQVKAELVRPGWYRPLTGRPGEQSDAK